MTNTTATKSTAARKGSAAPKPATKASKSTKATATKATASKAKPVKRATAVEKIGNASTVSIKPKGLDEQTRSGLIALHAAANAATEAYELAIVELLHNGASPSHVADALGIANSSVRRIGWRHGEGTPPAAQRKS